jgi:hypothetical protein
VSSDVKNPFPVGKPLIMINKEDLSKLQFIDGLCYLNEESNKIMVKGLCQVKILAPEMEIPFLVFR